MPFFHGIQVAEPVQGIRPVLEKSTAVIGLIATASAEEGEAADALDAAFPLDRPALVTDVRQALGQAGTGGTLKSALAAIADQGSPLIVVVRVAEGEDDAETTENVIGDNMDGRYTGMQALLAAEGSVGIRPRILGAPGLDTEDVTTAMLVVAKALRGFAYAACDGAETREAAKLYRDTFAARELMLIWPDATGWQGHAIAAALGLRAMIDERTGWHKTLSNIAVAGVTGTTKDVHFDIRDASTDAGFLNEGQVTTIVRMNGHRFWGNRTTSDEPLFAFETAVRTSQAIQDAIADALAGFIDRPMTTGVLADITGTVNAQLRQWKTEGRLIGGECWYDPASNPPEALAAGKLVIDYDYTPVAPLEGLHINQRITDKYYADFGVADAA